MKRIVLFAVGVILAMAIAAQAAEPDKTYRFLENGKVRSIGVTLEDKYLEVKTENGITYRIHPCGQVEKLVWKELNPNEDRGLYTGTWPSGGAITDLVYINATGLK